MQCFPITLVPISILVRTNTSVSSGISERTDRGIDKKDNVVRYEIKG